MKTKIIIILAAISLVLASFSFFMFNRNKQLKSDVQQQKQNVEILNKNYKTYKTAFVQSVAEGYALKYTLEEFKNYEERLTKEISDLNLKLKNVKSTITVVTKTELKTRVETVYIDSVKCFNFEDKWNKVSGCFTERDSVDLNLVIRDSLDIIPSIVPKHRFLWWTWGVKAVKINVISQNPYSEFEYLKYIELKK